MLQLKILKHFEALCHFGSGELSCEKPQQQKRALE
jgi:hypothetical protein